MKYAVIRFVRNKQPEQWIIPLEELLDYLYPDEEEENGLSLHLLVSVTLKQGQMYNLMFVHANTPISTASGFVNQSTYFLFEPRIQPISAALDAFITELTAIPHAQRVQVRRYTSDNTYRL